MASLNTRQLPSAVRGVRALRAVQFRGRLCLHARGLGSVSRTKTKQTQRSRGVGNVLLDSGLGRWGRVTAALMTLGFRCCLIQH